jgi:hypothetical protein
MTKIFDRSPETEKLIEILGAATPGMQFTYARLLKEVGSKNKDIRSNITSARGFLEKRDGIVFGAIRCVGIQRMTDEEIANGGLEIVGKMARQGKKGERRNRIVSGSKTLSPQASNTVIVSSAIFETLRLGAKGASTRIKIATIDGVGMLENLISSGKHAS